MRRRRAFFCLTHIRVSDVTTGASRGSVRVAVHVGVARSASKMASNAPSSASRRIRSGVVTFSFFFDARRAGEGKPSPRSRSRAPDRGG
eukprot:14810-Pelagococcus_subviridis.AAC.15